MGERISSKIKKVKEIALPSAAVLSLLAGACSDKDNSRNITDVNPTVTPQIGEAIEEKSKLDFARSIWIDVNNDQSPDVEIFIIGDLHKITVDEQKPFSIAIEFSPTSAIEQCFRKNDVAEIAQPICDKAQEYRDNYQIRRDVKNGGRVYGTLPDAPDFIINQPNESLDAPTYTVIGCTKPEIPIVRPTGEPQFGNIECN